MKHGLLALSILGLCAAASSHAESFSTYGPIYASYKQSPAKGGGCVSGSIGTEGPNNAYSSIVFVSEANADSTLKQGSFGYARGGSKNDFAPRLSAFTVCLKPGRYRIFGISTNNVYSTQRVAMPFEVVAGRNVYLGRFVFQGPGSRPQCQQGAPVYVTVSDEFERDSAAIQKHPQAARLPLDKQVVDPVQGAPYFVACARGH
ncbi:hypothetical protein V1318_04530 [Lysobacter sp. CCNWLW3]|uniref:hypothetical protein n=1 Tax=unclassified Lysobacter TaxID=2635362 RepID=UPI002FCE6FFA